MAGRTGSEEQREERKGRCRIARKGDNTSRTKVVASVAGARTDLDYVVVVARARSIRAFGDGRTSARPSRMPSSFRSFPLSIYCLSISRLPIFRHLRRAIFPLALYPSDVFPPVTHRSTRELLLRVYNPPFPFRSRFRSCFHSFRTDRVGYATRIVIISASFIYFICNIFRNLLFYQVCVWTNIL